MDDPGGIFASDAHRRVMANVPNPDEDALDVDGLVTERINGDDFLDLGYDELQSVLDDLEADGHVKRYKDGSYKNTASGFKALTGPVKET
jgi:hypothetical protein